jgi:hypothetical protein
LNELSARRNLLGQAPGIHLGSIAAGVRGRTEEDPRSTADLAAGLKVAVIPKGPSNLQ